MTDQKQNCWEFQGCGRGPDEGGACPACAAAALDGVHGGAQGGRACWVVTDTLCEGRISGPFERKISTCSRCAFYHRVAVEEGLDHIDSETLVATYQDPDAG